MDTAVDGSQLSSGEVIVVAIDVSEATLRQGDGKKAS